MNRIPQTRIYHSELEFISECVMYFPNTETGGDFFGFWSREGDPIIQYVTGPGDKTTRTEASFFQDIDYLHECGAVLHERYGLEHIGAWHSHHRLSLFKPSSGDVRTMRNALRNLHPSRFLISICNIEHEASVSIGCFLFSQNSESDYVSCPISVLAGSSPIRDALRNQQFCLLRETKQKIHGSISQTNRHSISYSLRNAKDQSSGPVLDAPKKPLFSESSFWSKSEGQRYLKNVYDKLMARSDLSDIGIKQLADGRPAISFDYQGTIYEIKFPINFPQDLPEVVAVKRQEYTHKGFWRKKIQLKISGVEEVYEIVRSLNMYDDGHNITIQQLQ